MLASTEGDPQLPRQPAIPNFRAAMKHKITRRAQFLAEMYEVVTWARLQALIEPNYPKVGRRATADAGGDGAAHLLLEELARP